MLVICWSVYYNTPTNKSKLELTSSLELDPLDYETSIPPANTSRAIFCILVHPVGIEPTSPVLHAGAMTTSAKGA